MYVKRNTDARPDLRILDTSLMVITFTTLRSHFISHSLYTRCGRVSTTVRSYCYVYFKFNITVR